MQHGEAVASYPTPIGPLRLVVRGGALVYLGFDEGDAPGAVPAPFITQLDEYFNGTRKVFDLPLDLSAGTAFRRRVWDALISVPYGETRSYKDIAADIGNERAVRAVGGANHNNPISIIVPCHRIIGADGSLTGYGGELWRKQWLLAHERKFSLS